LLQFRLDRGALFLEFAARDDFAIHFRNDLFHQTRLRLRPIRGKQLHANKQIGCGESSRNPHFQRHM
jgi:hypothetical protein